MTKDISKYLFLYLAIFIGLATEARAQVGTTYTEEEIKLQELFLKANSLKLMGDLEEALPIYQQVLKEDKTNDAAAYEIARIYEAQEDYENAEKYARKAVNWDNNFWYKIKLAQVLEKLDKDAEAASIFQGLVGAFPENMEFYYQWAYYLVRDSRPEEAIEVYNIAEKQFAVSQELVYKKHMLYGIMGKLDRAAGELEKLIEAFPSKLEYRHDLAEFYQNNKKQKQAEEIYQEILKLDPFDGRALMAVATKGKSANDATFLSSLEPVIRDSNVEIDVKVAKLFPIISKVGQGNKTYDEEAATLTQILTEVHPKSAKAHAIHGDVLYNSGKLEASKVAFEMTLELDNAKYAVWEQLMYLYFDFQEFDKLLKLTSGAQDLFPNQVKSYYFEGVVYSERGQSVDAISAFKKCMLMSRRQPELYFDVVVRLSKEYILLSDFTKAMETLKKSEKSGGFDRPEILELMGDASYYLKQEEEAKGYWQGAIEKGAGPHVKQKIDNPSQNLN